MDFVLLVEIEQIETIANNISTRLLARLRKHYGIDRWRTLKGTTVAEFSDGKLFLAEVHWYEASNTDKQELKIKRLLD